MGAISIKKKWGAWRYYPKSYLCSDENHDWIGKETIQEMLDMMSFNSIEEFNKILSSFPRGEIPLSIQSKIKNLFHKHIYTENDLINEIIISDGCVESLKESIILENPFKIAENIIQPEIEIYAMNIREESIFLKAGISSECLYEAKESDLSNLCEIFIKSKTTLNSSELSITKDYLSSQMIDSKLADDSEFLLEIGFQINHMIENIGIITKEFKVDDEEVRFWLEGEEEIGFN